MTQAVQVVSVIAADKKCPLYNSCEDGQDFKRRLLKDLLFLIGSANIGFAERVAAPDRRQTRRPVSFSLRLSFCNTQQLPL
jgi:hypothetical protein